MEEKTIYRTVITLEVLSEEPIRNNMSLEQINDECISGEFSGLREFSIKNSPIKGKNAVDLINLHGTDLDFFNIDENGFEI